MAMLDDHMAKVKAREARAKELQPIVSKWAMQNGIKDAKVHQFVDKNKGTVIMASVLTDQMFTKNYRYHIITMDTHGKITEVPFDKVPGKGWDFNKAYEYIQKKRV